MFASASAAEDLRDALAELVRDLDPATWDGQLAKRHVCAFSKIERLARNAKVIAMRRVHDTNATVHDPEPTAEDWLANREQGTTGTARRTSETAKLVEPGSAIEAAMRDGSISSEHAAKIAHVADLAPERTAEMIESARRDPWHRFRDRAGQAIHDAEDEATRAARQRRATYARRDHDDQGLRRFTVGMTPEQAAEFEKVWDLFWGIEFSRARTEGRNEHAGAYATDALVTMARLALAHLHWLHGESDRIARDVTAPRPAPAAAEPPSGSAAGPDACPPTAPTTAADPESWTSPLSPDSVGALVGPAARKSSLDVHALLLIDVAALIRGRTLPGDRCEIDGVGPVNLGYAKSLLGEATIDILVNDGVDIRTVAHAGRSPNRRQKAALLAQWECEIRGCHRSRRLEADHIVPFAESHETATPSLGPKCKYHHDLKSYRGWTDGPRGPDGKRDLHPPGHADTLPTLGFE